MCLVFLDGTVAAEALERNQLILELGSSIFPSYWIVLAVDDTDGNKAKAPFANGLKGVDFQIP